ncbi:MAG: chemotaxis protein CheD [Gemmatimonadaceae bacterium]|nr:chemotaxis protein CheD [Gemmatimonadaceae bacterium]
MESIALPLALPEVHVNVGDASALRERGVLSSIGLGSCVALVLYDRETRIGGLAHILLPHEALSRTPGKPSRYSTTALPHLLTLMRTLGPVVRPTARLVGGASMFANLLSGGGINMGERNIVATRRTLEVAGIPLVGEEVGEDYGRSAFLDLASGELRVTSIRHAARTV